MVVSVIIDVVSGALSSDACKPDIRTYKLGGETAVPGRASGKRAFRHLASNRFTIPTYPYKLQEASRNHLLLTSPIPLSPQDFAILLLLSLPTLATTPVNPRCPLPLDMGLFTTNPTNQAPPPAKPSPDGAFEAPNRDRRAHCWQARDAFFACLEQNNIVDSLKDKEAADAHCGEEGKGLERECASSWVSLALPSD